MTQEAFERSSWQALIDAHELKILTVPSGRGTG
jgi:hypothetical protein